MQVNNIWFLYARDIHIKRFSVRVLGGLVAHWRPGTGSCRDFPVVAWQGLAARARATAPDRSKQLGGTGPVLEPHTGHLPGDQDMLRPGWGVGPQLGPAQQGPWPAGQGYGKLETLWSDWDRGWLHQGGLKWGPGLWGHGMWSERESWAGWGWPWGDWARTGRPMGALQALTQRSSELWSYCWFQLYSLHFKWRIPGKKFFCASTVSELFSVTILRLPLNKIKYFNIFNTDRWFQQYNFNMSMYIYKYLSNFTSKYFV